MAALRLLESITQLLGVPVIVLRNGYTLGSITLGLLWLTPVPALQTKCRKALNMPSLKDSWNIQRLEWVWIETWYQCDFCLSFRQVQRHLEAVEKINKRRQSRMTSHCGSGASSSWALWAAYSWEGKVSWNYVEQKGSCVLRWLLCSAWYLRTLKHATAFFVPVVTCCAAQNAIDIPSWGLLFSSYSFLEVKFCSAKCCLTLFDTCTTLGSFLRLERVWRS